MSKQLKHKLQLRIIVQYSPLDHLTMMNYNAGIIIKKKPSRKYQIGIKAQDSHLLSAYLLILTFPEPKDPVVSIGK